MTVINTNVKSLIAQNALSKNDNKLATAMERLSSGSRINSAADDAAGLGIATRMSSQVRGLNMAIRNANDTISVTQTAEGAITEVSEILQRMRELAVQAASDQNNASDRGFLQAEVSQLSTEIDRIATTTQFNNMNLLDGSYANKKFQIGANMGQSIDLSIGSMRSSVLGVASSSATNASSPSQQVANVSGASAQGVASEPTVVKLSFEEGGAYAFTIADDVSGLTAVGITTGTTLDLSNETSKQAYVDQINLNLKEAATDSIVTGSATITAGNTVDLSASANFDQVKFDITIDGETESIDLRPRLINTATTLSATTFTEIETALQAELQFRFDSSVSSAISSSNKMEITDAQGRAISITQGAGDGTLFGTDAANVAAPLTAAKQVQTNLSVAWSGNDLLITNSAGGKTTVTASTTPAKLTFDVVSGAAGQNYDPVVLTNSVATDSAVSFTGRSEESSFAMSFVDQVGDGTQSLVSFKITDGSGNIFATVSNLDVHASVSDTSVVNAVRTVLATGIGTLDNFDDSFDIGDFSVEYENGTLVITNLAGGALAVEDYSSTHTAANFTPLNEISAGQVLSSQGNGYSETRMKLNTAAFTTDMSLDDFDFTLSVNGIAGTTNDIELQAVFDGTATGATVAAKLESEIQGATASAFIVQGGTTATEDLSNITVTWDENTSELVIRDSKGRNFGLEATQLASAGSGVVFIDESASAIANRSFATVVNSAVTKGDVAQATEVTMTLSGFSDNKTEIDFRLNGISLSAADSTTAMVATTTAVVWDSTASFEGSAAQTQLNALMTTLNSKHESTVYSYTVSGNSITFVNSDGGELEFSNFITDGAGNDQTVATLTPRAGISGSPATLAYHEVLATAYAEGTDAVSTSASLKLQSDDLVSFTLSDGVNQYAVGPTAIDISSSSSVAAFLTLANEALADSSIVASMDTDGKMTFTDRTGGVIALTRFATGSTNAATWTPKAGQGDALSVSSGFVGSASTVTSSGSVAGVGGGSGIAVAQISVETAAGASQALSVIDSALTYVNAERAKLGAVENRLGYTINNLSNIVTNTEASKSRILDTDYGVETASLAKAQIIQQAATAMLAQANQSSQSVLSLLQ
jgi:flagellin